MKYEINTLLPVQFEKIENPPYLNDSRFQAVRIYVAHEKDNYNSSWFDTSVLENMGKYMAGVPIVGYISVDNANKADFNGHEEKLTIKDGEISLEYLGRAYGCIISNDDVEIVQRMHESGEMRNYLAVTGILWKMFTDCIDIFERDGEKPHSMELQPDSIVGNFEDDGYFHFSEAKARALCILGDGVPPAMSNSIIEKFSTISYQDQVQELLNEINESIKQFSVKNQSSTIGVDNITTQEGGTILVDEKLELLKKFNLSQEDLSFSVEETPLEDLEGKINEHFTLLASQKQEEIANALKVEMYRDRWGDERSKYSYVDHGDAEVFAYDRQDNYNLYGFTYTTQGDAISIDFTSKKRKKFEIVDFVEGVSNQFELFPKEAIEYELNSKEKELTENFTADKETAVKEVKEQLDQITKDFEAIQPELERLKGFEKTTLDTERENQETVLFSQYEEELKDVEEFTTLKTNAGNYSLEELEKELALVYVKKNTNFSASNPKKDKVKLAVPHKDDSEESPYGKYLSE